MTFVKNLTLLSMFLILVACSSLSPLIKKNPVNDEKSTTKNLRDKNMAIFYKDGREAYISKCEGNSWLPCMTAAGETCKNSGYEILEKNSSKEASILFSDKDIKELYYVCKKIEILEKKID